VQAAKNRILIMPCGGINSANIVRIIRATSACEIHTSAGTSGPRASSNGNRLSHGTGAARSTLQSALFEKNVLKLVSRLNVVSQERSAETEEGF
jgi:copper homeostasis protein CutC